MTNDNYNSIEEMTGAYENIKQGNFSGVFDK
jgi:hypothetical protein